MKTPTIKDIRTAAAARQTRRARRKTLLLSLGWLVIVGVVLVGVVLPKVVRSQLESRLQTAFDRTVVVGAVEANLLTLGVTVSDGLVEDRDGQLLAKWDRLHVNLRAIALMRGRAGFDAIELEGFEGRVVVDREGKLNFDDLFAGEGETEAETDEGWGDLEIGRLEVTGAQIDFADESRSAPFTTSFGPVSFSLQDFHTRGDPQAPYRFEAVTEAGEKLQWGGTLSLTPLRSSGRLALSDFQIRKYKPYYDPAINFEVRDGVLSGATDYVWEAGEGGGSLSLVGGALGVKNLGLSHESTGPVAVEVGEINLTGINYESWSTRLGIEQISWDGGRLAMVRSQMGVDIERWFGGESEQSDETAFRVEIGKLGVENVKVDWRDETNLRPVTLIADKFSLAVMNLNTADLAAAVPVAMGLDFEDGGRVTVTGETGLSPFRPALMIAAEALKLERYSPYVEASIPTRISQGDFMLKGSMGMVGDGLVFRGDAALSGVKLATLGDEELAGWEDLQIEGLSYANEPTTWAIESIRWVRPEGRLQVRRDGALNWNRGAGSEPEEPSIEMRGPALAEEGTEAVDDDAVVRVDRVELVEAHVEFSDESLPRKAQVTLTGLSGTLVGLSSLQVGRGEAELSGFIDGKAPVTISGDFNPLGTPAYTDLKMKFDRVDLGGMGGYVSKYAGYQLARGRLSLDVDFKLEDRVIRSSTVATLDDFELGEKFSSPDATQLPVKLAVALLQDRAGQIVIDLPVEGALDDPTFRVGRVIGRVLGNVLTKAATAPFSLLGGMLGEGRGDPNTIGFTAGLTTLEDGGMQKLSRMAQALSDRPLLVLEVKSGVDLALDAAALQPLLLERDLRLAGGVAEDSSEPWTQSERMASLVTRFTQVFGHPPIDLEGQLPPPTEPAEPSAEEAIPLAAAEVDPSLLGWLKRVLGGNAKTVGEEEPVEVENPLPEVIPELPALPAEEIAARLLAQIEVSENDLESLANARAEAVVDYLVERGFSETRITVLPFEAGAMEVKLGLR